MIRKIHTQLFAILLLAFVFTACSKDDDDSNNSTPDDSTDNPAEVSDPASLDEGTAEFAAAGNETFNFSNATSSWTHNGFVEFSGRKYTTTDLNLRNAADDVYLSVTFFVHDPNADINGGELPVAGTYDFDLTFTELTSEDTESYAEVFVGGDGLEYYYEDNGSSGTVEITSFDGNILEGQVNLSNMTNSENEDVSLNVAASFKADEG